MKRFILSLAGLCLIGCAHTFASPAAPASAPEDTIIITMPDNSKMLIYVKDKQDLKKFRNYNVDSLISSLGVYLNEMPKPGTDTTLIVKARTQKGTRTSQVQVTVSGTDTPAETALVRALATLTRHQEMLDRNMAMLEKQRAMPGLSEKNREELAREQENLRTEQQSLAKEKETLTRELEQARKAAGSAEGRQPYNVRITASDSKLEVTKEPGKPAKPGSEEKAPPKPRYHEFEIDLGFNNLVNRSAYRNPAGEVVDYELRPFGSRYVSLNWVTGSRIGGPESPFRIQSGLEFNFNNLMFDNNVRIANLDNQVLFFTEPDLKLQKSKLAISYLTIPVMAGVQFKNKKGNDSFSFLAGGYAGYRIGSHTKIKYTDADGDSKKEKGRGSFNLMDYQYGLSATIGYGDFVLFTKYNLTDLFKDNRGPQTQLINFGFRI